MVFYLLTLVFTQFGLLTILNPVCFKEPYLSAPSTSAFSSGEEALKWTLPSSLASGMTVWHTAISTRNSSIVSEFSESLGWRRQGIYWEGVDSVYEVSIIL